MASSSAYHCFSPDNDAHATTDGFCDGYPIPEDCIFSSLPPHHGYNDLQEEPAFSTPVCSIGWQPGLPVVGLTGNANGGFNNSQNLYDIWPFGDHPIVTDPVNSGIDAFGLTPSLGSTFNLNSPLVPTRNLPNEAAGFSDISSIGILDGNVQRSAGESFFFGRTAKYGNTFDNDVERRTDAPLDIPDPQRLLHKPGQYLPMTVPLLFEDRAWSLGRGPSYELDDLFQNNGYWDLEHHGEILDPLPQAHQQNEVFGDTPPESYRSLTIKRPSPQCDSLETASSSKRARMTSGYRNLISKSQPSYAGIIEETSSHDAQPQEPKKGCRHGPLTPETRQKTLRMRGRGACACCYTSHVTCSEDRPVCKNCQLKNDRRTLRFGCHIGPMKDYTGAIIPDILTEDLSQPAVDKWIKEKQIVFTVRSMTIQVSADPFGFTISLPVHEIYSADQSYLLVPDLSSVPKDDMQYFTSRPSLQYGIYNRPPEYLRQKCSEYFDSVSKFSMDTAEDISGDTPTIIWKVLRALGRFAQANPGVKTVSVDLLSSLMMSIQNSSGAGSLTVQQKGLLQAALNVFWMYYMMGRSLALSEDSAVKAIESLQNSTAVHPPLPFISAVLVGRQMKVIMIQLLEETIQELLQGMEKELRHNSSSWAICFSSILILCILAGQAGVATDAKIIHKTSCEEHDVLDIRKKGIKASQALETALNYAWGMFAGIQGKHHPIRDNCPIGHSSKQSKEEADFIHEMHELVNRNEDEILDRASRSFLSGSSETPADHFTYRALSPAHYLCKFLKEFH